MSMFDTHCHLNFKTFEGKISTVIEAAKKVGVNYFVVPGTEVENSKKAVEIAEKFDDVYAAVGIHPHHVFVLSNAGPVPTFPPVGARFENTPRLRAAGSPSSRATRILKAIEILLVHPKVVAVGEVGLDRHYYQKTKYIDYQINPEFIEGQKLFFIEQIKLAKKYEKALIIHNRQAKKDLLKILTDYRLLITENRCVFHCCEPEDDLLEFAKRHKIYIGVDGDVTYNKKKQEFVKKIPLELLVLETDSPYLLPEPLRSQKLYPNEPKNLPLIAEFIADLTNQSFNRLINWTTENSKKLFKLGY